MDQNKRWFGRRNLFLSAVLLGCAALSVVALIAPLSSRSANISLAVGDVATLDILSPRTLTYESQILTNQQREAAANAIAPVFGAPDAQVARNQVTRMRSALSYINVVRLDQYANTEQKLSDLSALQDIHLSPDAANALLAINENSWSTVQQEAIVVLEQVMRSTIREDRLEEARRSVPALVSLSLTEEQANLVSEIVAAFVSPNSLYSESLTEARREEARDAVPPVERTYISGETVIRRGQVVTAAHLEALEALDLIQPEVIWQEQVSVIAVVLAVMFFTFLYMRDRRKFLSEPRNVILVAFLFLFFLFTARLTIPNRTVIPFLFPVASFSLLLTVLFNPRVGLGLAIPLGVLVGFGLPNNLELTLFYTFSSLIGVLVLYRAEHLTVFFRAGTAVALSGVLVVVSFRIADPTTDTIGLLTLIGAAILNGLGSASVALILQFFLAQTLGLPTALQLLEISRPDHPLLQFILRSAPGTYQHSLLVANLAEQAAEMIDADALLTRVGALFHDAGKARFPHFFIENQVPGSINPHDELSPEESAAVIIRHVPDGAELAHKHHLPPRLIDFIWEHHGTMLTYYQYSQAVERAGGKVEKVPLEDYRYPGPRPQSRETALVMLADGCEARTRAERPESDEALFELVKDTIDTRVQLGELDDTTLTMRDIKVIVDSFVTTLRGVYHPRINYPKQVVQTGSSKETAGKEQ